MKEIIIKSNVSDKKEIKYKIFKVSPSVPTSEQLDKINQFTRRKFTAEELYIGQLRLAHNAIDRDDERFSEFTLQGFAETAVRKTLLFDHNRDIKDNAVGKYFDVEVEKMPLAIAISDLGEELKLPDGMTEVMIVSPWFYIPRAGVDEKDIIKLDAGIYDFASIGFNAENYVRITDNEGNTLYYEYRGKGETREGSLVYLGAQQGMSVKSSDNPVQPGSDKSAQNKINSQKQGGEGMKDLIKKLGEKFKKTFTEEGFFGEIVALISEKDAEIATLKTMADIGTSYKSGLVAEALKFGTLIGEIKADEASQDSEKKFLSGLDIDRLKIINDKYEVKARKDFPSEFTIQSADETDRKTPQTGESSIVTDAKKRAEAAQKK